MRPVRTGAANVVYRGPTDEIGDLWVQRVHPGQVRAVFDLDDVERALIAQGGRVELAIHSEPMPPVSLVVLPEAASRPVAEHPFKVDG